VEDVKKIAVAGATGRVGRHVSEVLAGGGHEVVAISRATGVDIIIGAGLGAALSGVEVIVDAATGPSPDQQPATEFFVTAAHNLQEVGVRAGVRRAVVGSIINTGKFAGGYGLAKMAHEDAWRSGPIPVRIVRAAGSAGHHAGRAPRDAGQGPGRTQPGRPVRRSRSGSTSSSGHAGTLVCARTH
jgi:uncharacterized protein YbjT (DUF2867 family)